MWQVDPKAILQLQRFHAGRVTRFGVRPYHSYFHGRPTDDQRDGHYTDWP